MRITLTGLLIVLLVSCGDDESLIPDIFTGKATSLKNGEEWKSRMLLGKDKPAKSDSLELAFSSNAYNDYQALTELISIRPILPTFDKQLIWPAESGCTWECRTGGWFLTIVDGHEGGDRYDVDTTAADNFIQIISYNKSKSTVEGIFNVTFVLTSDDGLDGIAPPKLEFTNGTFKSKVEREWFE